MSTTYVFGHKKPDTDSICASICYSYLRNQLGDKTEPKALGNINNETKFVLNYFNVKEPKYLNDVKLQIKDVNYIKNCYAFEKQSINKSFVYMREKELSALPIVDEHKKLTGLVTLKELAKELIEGDFTHLNTSYDNIIEVLDGTEVLKFDDEIKGSIFAVSFRTSTFIETISLKNDDILIVGDRQNVIEHAIKSKVKLLIIVGNFKMSEENYKLAKENKVNVISTGINTYLTSKLINLSNYIKTVSFSNTPICFEQNEYYSQFVDVYNKTHHTNYPVINNKGECLGLLNVNIVNSKNPKKVILVDHNEKEQSVDGLEEADIVTIIDHHKLGTLATTLPINFRNMAVGSTNTIIYNIYKENKVDIPRDIAGLMLSGIISDTLLLKSPTTTKLDIEVVNELEKIANIDYKKYGMEMFKAGSSLEGKTKEEIIYEDFKKFNYNDENIGVGQVFTTDIQCIMNEKEEYINLLNNIAVNNNYNVVALFITDIINNGSYILFNDNSKDILKESFNNTLEQGTYLKDVVSRKKQMIPAILETLEKRN